MKLSMWMIANRVSSLNPELHIRPDAAPILKSARRAYATDCVHVYQSGNDVICNGEGDYILLKDMDLSESFELIQCVFDFYEDWISEIVSLIKKHNYKELVNQCWNVFHNPMILFDGNCRVLGMSEQYTTEDLDEEWKYLATYGYSSANALNYIKYQHVNRDFTRAGIQSFSFEGGLSYSGATCGIYFNDMMCGRINLLEKDRKLNSGDYQILTLLSDFLKTELAQQDDLTSQKNANLFHLLLDGKPVDSRLLSLQLYYSQWQEQELYQLFLIDTGSASENRDLLNLLTLTAMQTLSDCQILHKDRFVVIICNISRHKGPSVKNALLNITKGAGFSVSCSLIRKGLLELRYLLEQAEAALELGNLQSKEETFYNFYFFAIDYILESPDLENTIRACHPGIYELWCQSLKKQDPLFSTLSCFLEHDCSFVATSKALFIHRNTLVYRVNKIKEILTSDLEDIYTRDYAKLSIRALQLYEKRNPCSCRP